MLRYLKIFIFALTGVFLSVNTYSINSVDRIEIEPEFAVVEGMESNVHITVYDSLDNIAAISCFSSVFVDGEKIDIYLTDGEADFKYVFNEKKKIEL